LRLPNVAAIVKVESRTELKDRSRFDTRYYISSAKTSAKRAAEAVRGIRLGFRLMVEWRIGGSIAMAQTVWRPERYGKDRTSASWTGDFTHFAQALEFATLVFGSGKTRASVSLRRTMPRKLRSSGYGRLELRI